MNTMKAMPTRLKAGLLVLCLLMFSCQREENRAETVAENFLKAYYSAQYARAARLCTPELARLVVKGELPQELPEQTEQKIKEAVSQTSFKIVSVEVDEESSCATVCYELSAPGLERPAEKRLVLKLEGRSAAVDRIE